MHKVDFDNLIIDDVIEDQEEMIEWHKSKIFQKDDFFNMSWIDVENDKHKKYIKYHQQMIEWLKELKERRKE